MVVYQQKEKKQYITIPREIMTDLIRTEIRDPLLFGPLMVNDIDETGKEKETPVSR